MRERQATATRKIDDFIHSHEFAEAFYVRLGEALEGLTRFGQDATTFILSRSRALRRAQHFDKDVQELADLQRVDLHVGDNLCKSLRLGYTAAMAAEGTASALAITGLEVSSTVSGGTTFALAVGAIVADTVANVTAISRAVANVAINYGYDVADPDERLYMLGAISYGDASNAAGHAAALGYLSRLTQAMMRHPNHAVLSKNALIKVISTFMRSFGFRVTHRRLAQAVPFAGVVLSAGSNSYQMQRLMTRVQDVYRLRHLTERYGLDPSTWLHSEEDQSGAAEAEVIDVESLVDAALCDEANPDESEGLDSDQEQ